MSTITTEILVSINSNMTAVEVTDLMIDTRRGVVVKKVVRHALVTAPLDHVRI
jgi:hypothetical protein